MSKKVLVCGAGGFIGNHLVNDLKSRGYCVIGIDLEYPQFSETNANKFYQFDLRNEKMLNEVLTSDISEVYQLAADMGGAGYIFTGDNDANIMHNSVLINLNVLNVMVKKNVKKVFYSSSACMYPAEIQSTTNVSLKESDAYPANPDSEYGWEKLFSERLYMAYARNYNFDVRIARLHNVFGTHSSYDNGKEKAPAALCRKVAIAKDGDNIEIWGQGNQTRSFLYIEECLEGIHRLMESSYNKPINLGSDRMISINDLALLICKIANKNLNIINVTGPTGVEGRNSDNTLITEILKWKPQNNLEYGLTQTYQWIEKHVRNKS
jgi:nucleoside-diphosphate-sugar epimerase